MFRLYQYQTNVVHPEIKAGDWFVQMKIESGDWENYEGPYKHRDAAEIRLWYWQLSTASEFYASGKHVFNPSKEGKEIHF